MNKSTRILTAEEIQWELQIMRDNFINNRKNGASIVIGQLRKKG